MRQPPTFIGIGAHKAGTSWLFKHLANHPEVWIPPVKEIHYFDRSPDIPSANKLATSSPFKRIFGNKPWERTRIKGGTKHLLQLISKRNYQMAYWWFNYLYGYYNDEWYCSLFKNNKGAKITGEISPTYSLLDDEQISHIKEVNQSVKILFIIRNPIDRAWSAIRFRVHKGFKNIDLNSSDDIINELKRKDNILLGNYKRTIDKYLKYFSPSQILICFYDAITYNPVSLMNNITSFLNITPFNKDNINNNKKINASPSRNIPPKVETYLFNQYSNKITELNKILGSYTYLWEKDIFKHFNTEISLNEIKDYPTTMHPIYT